MARGAAGWGAVGLGAGGAVWIILGLGALLGVLQRIPGREDVVLFVLALSLTGVGLLGLQAAQAGRLGRVGTAGLYLALLAISVRAAGGIVYLLGSSALERFSVAGTASMILGLLLYGIATSGAGVFPRAYGLVLAISMPVSVSLGALGLAPYDTLLFGAVLLALGLWARRLKPAVGPPRVR